MNYWIDKENRKNAAAAHHERMELEYADEIAAAAQKSIVYSMENDAKIEYKESKNDKCIKLQRCTTVDGIMRSKGKVAALNFASYKNPGGKFLEGSSAQEESLCHQSDLYEVLLRKPEYYEYNNRHLNYGLYTHRGIYTPDIVIKDGKRICDVITCAAPNWSVVKRYHPELKNENEESLKERIAFVNYIAAMQGVETFVVGAWGCGVFGQNVEQVIKWFKEFQMVPTLFFAIPDQTNFEKAEEVLFPDGWGMKGDESEYCFLP